MSTIFDTKNNPARAWLSYAILIAVLMAFPFVAANFGNSWVRIIDMALLYIMLALGLNIVVGFAGLLDRWQYRTVGFDRTGGTWRTVRHADQT